MSNSKHSILQTFFFSLIVDGRRTIYSRTMRITFALFAILVLVRESVFSQTPAGTSIKNTAVMRAELISGRELPVQNDSASITVQESGELVLQKLASPTVPLPNDTVYYSIIARNTLNATLFGIHVVDTLPSTVLFLSSNGGIVSNSVVRWDIDSLVQGSSDTLHIVVRVLPNIPAGTNITNIVHGNDTTGASTSDSIQIIVGAAPQMSIAKSVSKDSVIVGDSLLYILRVQNIGNAFLTNVTMKDTLPTELINVTVSSNATLSNGIVSYFNDSLSLNEKDSVHIRGTVSPSTPSNIILLNRVVAQSNETPEQFAQVTTITVRRDTFSLEITKSASKDSVVPYDSLQYIIHIRNTGNVSLTNISVKDTLPILYLNNIVVSSNAQLLDSVVSYAKDTLHVNGNDSIIISAKVRSGNSGYVSIENRAYAQSSQTFGQSDSVSTILHSTYSLNVAKTVSDDSVVVGDSLRYVLRVNNTGNSALTNVTMNDTLSNYLINVTVSPNATLTNNIVSYSNDTLRLNQTDSVWIRATLSPSAPSNFLLVNRVVAQSNQTSSQLAQVTTVTVRKDTFSLAFEKIASHDTIAPYQVLTYTLYIRNNGNIGLTNISVRDTLPFHYFTNVTVSNNGQLVDSIVTYSKPTLNVNEQDSIIITATVIPATAHYQTITNNAFAQSGETPAQFSSASTVLYSNRSFTLAKLASTTQIGLDSVISYKISFKNTGNFLLNDFSVWDTIPIQLTDVVTSNNVTYANRVVTYSSTSFPIGAADSFSISARVYIISPDTIRNYVYAVSAELSAQEAQAASRIIAPPPVDRSCVVSTTVQPSLIIGNGIDAAVISVYATDTLGNPKPNGTPVYMSSPIPQAQFSNGQNSIIVPTYNGWAIDSIRALLASSQILYSQIISEVNDSTLCQASDTIEIVFFPGAVSGTVVNQSTGLPVKGAIVRVYSSPTFGDTIVGQQTTLADGKYVIPVPRTDNYRVTITTTNIFGQSSTITTNVNITVPGTGGNPPIANENSISGSIYYVVSNQPIPVPNIEITLTRLPAPSISSKYSLREIPFVIDDSTFTDSVGSYKFTNVDSGATYRVSIRHPQISGSDTVTNQGNGQLVIDVNIPVVLNPQLQFVKSGPALAKQSDTAVYSINYRNDGTLSITSSVITDSLDSMMKFVSASNGGVYDTLGHRVLWAIGTIDTQSSGVVSLTIQFADTLTANRTAVNRAIFTSAQTLPTLSEAQTQVVLPANVRIWKTSSTHNAQPGDTIVYSITATNTTGSRADSITISDALPNEVLFLAASPSGNFDSLTNTLTWNADSLRVNDTLRYTINARVRTDLQPGEYQYTNIATFAWNQGSTSSALDTASNALVTTLVSYLQISKQAMKKVLEIGDIATYIVRVTNLSSTSVAESIRVIDDIPFGFRYIKNSSFRDSVKIAEPSGTKQLRWNLIDSLMPNSSAQLIYRLVVGAGGVDGNGINTAQAIGVTPLGVSISSARVSEKVEVRRGVFTERGLIIGKVFFDPNENSYQDSGEVGVKGVELMMEDGTRVMTGDDGKYSLPDVAPGDHVLKVRKHTLPSNSELHSGYDDFANEPSSRFVKVTESGIARADFYLIPTVKPVVALSQEVAKIGTLNIQRIAEPRNVVFIEDERLAPFKLSGTNFEVGKANLLPDAFPALHTVANVMREYDDQPVIIAGHTDSVRIRTKEFPDNQALSNARARAVKKYLVEQEGIDSSRIQTLGFGPTKPIATNKTKEGRFLNRRVEFFFQPSTEMKPRKVTSIVFRIPVDYDGTQHISKIEIVDVLDTAFHFDTTSATLGEEKISARVEGQNLHWIIENVGTSFHKTLTYSASLYQQEEKKVSISSQSTIRYFIGDSVIENSSIATTTNNVATAIRGKAVNFVFSGVLFDVGKSTLRPAAMSAMENAARELNSDVRTSAIIEGHTDSRPINTKEFPNNFVLSSARARTVKSLLVDSFQVSGERMQYVGYGELRPIGSNETNEGRQINRRVEIRVFKQEFVEEVMPEGFIDSSEIVAHTFIPSIATTKFDDASFGVSTEQFILKLKLEQTIGGRVVSTALYDSLPAGLKLVPNTIKPLSGIDSAWSSGNMIFAKSSLNDSLAVISFFVEIDESAKPEGNIEHTFTIERKFADGSVLFDKAKALLIEVRKRK